MRLRTGRADYFGEMPNLAARVAGLAHPGQILVEGTSGFTARSASSEKGGGGVPGALTSDRSFNKEAKRDDMVTTQPSRGVCTPAAGQAMAGDC